MKSRKKKVLKINEKNDIESIIEAFQRFEKKYEIKICKLDDGIQYEVKNRKIAQTYKSTILEADTNKIIKKLKNKSITTIIIVNNIRNAKKTRIVNDKIKRLDTLSNIETRITRKNNLYDVIESIIEGG